MAPMEPNGKKKKKERKKEKSPDERMQDIHAAC
jgi:hypothetical protein